ncbi:MAG: hypothetical protein WCJ18_09765 [Planctomycetota bacterium]
MHDSLTKHAAQLARLVMMIRIGLESAEAAIPGINDLLAELAILGLNLPMTSRHKQPAGFSADGSRNGRRSVFMGSKQSIRA